MMYMTEEARFWFGLGDFIFTLIEILFYVGVIGFFWVKFDKSLLQYKWIRTIYSLFDDELNEDVERLED